MGTTARSVRFGLKVVVRNFVSARSFARRRTRRKVSGEGSGQLIRSASENRRAYKLRTLVHPAAIVGSEKRMKKRRRKMLVSSDRKITTRLSTAATIETILITPTTVNNAFRRKVLTCLLLLGVNQVDRARAKGLVGKLPGNPASCPEEPCNSDPQHVLYALKWTSLVFGLILLLPILMYYISKLISKIHSLCSGGSSSSKSGEKGLDTEALGGSGKQQPGRGSAGKLQQRYSATNSSGSERSNSILQQQAESKKPRSSSSAMMDDVAHQAQLLAAQHQAMRKKSSLGLAAFEAAQLVTDEGIEQLEQGARNHHHHSHQRQHRLSQAFPAANQSGSWRNEHGASNYLGPDNEVELQSRHHVQHRCSLLLEGQLPLQSQDQPERSFIDSRLQRRSLKRGQPSRHSVKVYPKHEEIAFEHLNLGNGASEQTLRVQDELACETDYLNNNGQGGNNGPKNNANNAADNKREYKHHYNPTKSQQMTHRGSIAPTSNANCPSRSRTPTPDDGHYVADMQLEREQQKLDEQISLVTQLYQQQQQHQQQNTLAVPISRKQRHSIDGSILNGMAHNMEQAYVQANERGDREQSYVLGPGEQVNANANSLTRRKQSEDGAGKRLHRQQVASAHQQVASAHQHPSYAQFLGLGEPPRDRRPSLNAALMRQDRQHL